MVVDSSAVLAILFNEPERDMFSDALADAGVRLMSSVNALETAVVVSSRKGSCGVREFDLLLHRAEFEVSRSPPTTSGSRATRTNVTARAFILPA